MRTMFLCPFTAGLVAIGWASVPYSPVTGSLAFAPLLTTKRPISLRRPRLTFTLPGLGYRQLRTSKDSSEHTDNDSKTTTFESVEGDNGPKKQLYESEEGWIEAAKDTLLSSEKESLQRRDLIINTITGGLLVSTGIASAYLFQTMVYTPPGFVRLPSTQFIAALGDPLASSGTIDKNQPWGLWRLDPGPRGVWLRDYDSTVQSSLSSSLSSTTSTITTPAGWTLNPNDFWLEEHGIIMETPEFPLPHGRYLVTGGRSVVTGMTIAADGTWKLDPDDNGNRPTLYDVTHLPCRAARYQPLQSGGSASGGIGSGSSPASANLRDFPVAPGATMPNVEGCRKQDYAVLFLIGKEAK